MKISAVFIWINKLYKIRISFFSPKTYFINEMIKYFPNISRMKTPIWKVINRGYWTFSLYKLLPINIKFIVVNILKQIIIILLKKELPKDLKATISGFSIRTITKLLSYKGLFSFVSFVKSFIKIILLFYLIL